MDGSPQVRLGWREVADPRASSASTWVDGALRRREWPPVQLASLPRSGAAPWPGEPGAIAPPAVALEAALTALERAEPRLLRIDTHPQWRQRPVGEVTANAAADRCRLGLRVVWRLPAGTALRDWAGVLDGIGAAGLGLKLLVDAADLPDFAWIAARSSWWTLAPVDADELLACLAGVLAQEAPTLLAIPEGVQLPIAPWPERQPYMPGSGRWLAGPSGSPEVAKSEAETIALGASAVHDRRAQDRLVCLASDVDLALRLRNLGLARRQQIDVLVLTSLAPLPESDLRAGAPARLLVVQPGHAARGLAEALAAIPGLAPLHVVRGPDDVPGTAP